MDQATAYTGKYMVIWNSESRGRELRSVMNVVSLVLQDLQFYIYRGCILIVSRPAVAEHQMLLCSCILLSENGVCWSTDLE